GTAAPTISDPTASAKIVNNPLAHGKHHKAALAAAQTPPANVQPAAPQVVFNPAANIAGQPSSPPPVAPALAGPAIAPNQVANSYVAMTPSSSPASQVPVAPLISPAQTTPIG